MTEVTPEELARFFHETYETLAPEHGYETRLVSRKPWEEVPEQNRSLMLAVCAEVLSYLSGAAISDVVITVAPPGSVVFLRVPGQAEAVAQALSKRFGDDWLVERQILVVDESIGIEVLLDTEAMAAAGWVRRDE